VGSPAILNPYVGGRPLHGSISGAIDAGTYGAPSAFASPERALNPLGRPLTLGAP
jgi:hypothetical protein